ncbi:MAG: hypothetical protein ACREPM_25900 [Gemmatimonadaceae bacterium]
MLFRTIRLIIGIRLAPGAPPGAVVRSITMQGVWRAVLGVVGGAAGFLMAPCT